MELGERIEPTVTREAREETGLDVRDLQLLCWHEFVHATSFWKRRHFLFFAGACHTGSTDVRLNGEAEAALWSDPQNTLGLPITSYTPVPVQEYLKEKKLDNSAPQMGVE